MKSAHKIKVGFFTGGISVLTGFVIQFWVVILILRSPPDPVASQSKMVTQVILVEFSIVLVVIGATMVVFSFDRWLQSGHED